MGTDLNIGHATAYAYAKSKGYTGTEEQFATELAQFAQNAQKVAEDRAAVEQLVDEFLNTTAPAVIQDVTDEGTSQVERVAGAGTAQVTRVGQAGDAQIDAVAAAGTTQIGLVTAEGTTQVTRVQDKGDEVIDSIPADYTALTQEVSDLNRQLTVNDRNVVDGVVWEIGSINSETGRPVTYNTRIRTKDYIDVSNYREIVISINTDYRCAVIWYDDDNTLVRSDAWIRWENTSFIPPDGASKLKIVVGKIAEVPATLDYANEITVVGHTNIGYLYETVSDSDLFVFEPGAISGSTGGDSVDPTYLATRRRTQKVFIPSESIITLDNPNAYAMTVFYFTPTDEFVTDTGYLADSRYVTPYGRYVRLQVKRVDGTNFTDADNVTATITYMDSIARQCEQRIDALEEQFTNLDVDFDKKQIVKAFAAKRRFEISTFENNTARNPIPSFVHVTDCHGDVECFDFAVRAANLLNVTAILNTGDAVRYYATDDYSYVINGAEKATMPLLPVVGNHEMYSRTEQQMYEKIIKPFESNLTLPEVTNPTYYYKDFATEKLRIIAVNQWQYFGSANDATKRNYTQEQITFLCNTLLSTPENYGVIILAHTPEKKCVETEQYNTFYQSEYNPNVEGLGADIYPVYDIIDAFISGATINNTYSNLPGATPETFTANADFSGKNSGVEFIAFVCGHEHRDAIHYAPNYENKILILNATCSCHWSYKTVSGTDGSGYPYYTELSDLPRVEGDYTQYAFNVYGIDRGRGVVRVARIGSDTTYSMKERASMAIPYK